MVGTPVWKKFWWFVLVYLTNIGSLLPSLEGRESIVLEECIPRELTQVSRLSYSVTGDSSKTEKSFVCLRTKYLCPFFTFFFLFLFSILRLPWVTRHPCSWKRQVTTLGPVGASPSCNYQVPETWSHTTLAVSSRLTTSLVGRRRMFMYV